MQEPDEKSSKASAGEKNPYDRIREKLFTNYAGTIVIELIILVLAVPMNWQKSREVAVLLLIFGAGLIFLKREYDVKSSVVIIAVIAISSAVVYLRAGPSHVVGWLQPANEPTPPNNCGDLPKGSVIAMTGNFATVIAPRSSWKTGIVKLGSCELLSIGRNANGASIDAVLYSNDGKAGEIHDNKFTVNEDGYVIDKDLNTLVVHDKNDVEVIYVRYLNENAFRIRGVFSCPSSVAKQVTITNTNFPFIGEGKGCAQLSRFIVDLQ